METRRLALLIPTSIAAALTLTACSSTNNGALEANAPATAQEEPPTPDRAAEPDSVPSPDTPEAPAWVALELGQTAETETYALTIDSYEWIDEIVLQKGGNSTHSYRSSDNQMFLVTKGRLLNKTDVAFDAAGWFWDYTCSFYYYGRRGDTDENYGFKSDPSSVLTEFCIDEIFIDRADGRGVINPHEEATIYLYAQLSNDLRRLHDQKKVAAVLLVPVDLANVDPASSPYDKYVVDIPLTPFEE